MPFILFQSRHPYTLLNYQGIHNFPPSPMNILYLNTKLLIHEFFLLVLMVPPISTKDCSCHQHCSHWGSYNTSNVSWHMIYEKHIHTNCWIVIYKVCYWIKALILNITRYFLFTTHYSIWYQMCHWYQVWFFTMLAKYEATNLPLLYAKVRNFTLVSNGIMSCGGDVMPEPKTSLQGKGANRLTLE